MWEPPIPPRPPSSPPPLSEAPTDPGLGRIPVWRAPVPAPAPAAPRPTSPSAPAPAFVNADTSPTPTIDDAGLLDLRAAPADRAPRSRIVTAMLGLALLVLLAGTAILTVVVVTTHHHPKAASTPAPSSTSPPTTGRTAARTPTKKPSPTPTKARSKPVPAGQVAARTISSDIAASVAARRLVGPATDNIRGCRATAVDVRQLNRAATTRSGLVTALGRLDVRGLPGGAAVVARLRAAWTYSARADHSYAAWGLHHLGCAASARTTGDPDWDRANQNDDLATAAKTKAAKLWNPIARRYHLPTRTAGTI